jgi:hypothetical protein
LLCVGGGKEENEKQCNTLLDHRFSTSLSSHK